MTEHTAHRISTIRNAKLIHCIGQGKILESGTHSELVDAGGAYARIVVAQRLHDLDADQKPSEANEATSEQAETIDDKEEEASNLQEAKTVEAPTKQLYSTLAVMQRLYAMNRQHWLKYLFAIAGAVLQGLVLPIFAYVQHQLRARQNGNTRAVSFLVKSSASSAQPTRLSSALSRIA